MAKRKGKKFFALILLGVIVVILTIFGSIAVIYIGDKMNQINIDNTQDENILQNEEIKDTNVSHGYRNIVVFGLDSRENQLKDSANSDTIVIVSINNDTKDIKLVSVYRDTYLYIPDRGYRKVNSAYLHGGYSLALSTLNQSLDLNATEFVTVNFRSVVKVIDLLGGITLDITPSELKWLNGYIKEINRVNGTSVSALASSGTQVVNGTQALAYARIRYTSGGDFKRTERQRIVMSKIFEKVKNCNLSTLNQIANEVLPYVYTNLKKTELLSLAKDVFSYNIVGMSGFPFEPDAHYHSGCSYVFPIDLAKNVSELHAFLFGTTDYVPSQTVQNYSAEIEAARLTK